MINSNQAGPTTEKPDAASLFETAGLSGRGYNEAFAAAGVPRAHWQSILQTLGRLGPNGLRQRQERVRRMRHEDGATFNPFNDPVNDPGMREPPWALEMIPLPITAREWTTLETGLQQRARLLEMILADVYGPQTLLKNGWLPAECVYDNPRFLRPTYGVQPAGNRFLTFYAADVYRDADGRFRVLRDFGANPAGLGYALENRIVISRIFSELYQQTQVRRLAPFFQAFHDSLVRRVATRREDPGIVILSPGPTANIYFEHALLSRYLGYPLVEGQDLTVRDGEVFLKKLAGLEPVEVIFRHVPDEDTDPFAFRKATSTGIAGLIQAARQQRIEIINPIGAGFVDTPVLPALLPDLCRHLMGEILHLDSYPAWWCGTAEGLGHVLENIESLTVVSAMTPSLPAMPEHEDLSAAMQAAPYRFMGRAPLSPAGVPAWNVDGVRERCTILRLFACAEGQGFRIMPGGLAITAPDESALWADRPEKLQSKDIWVFSDQPVKPVSLMASLQAPAEFRRGSDLPSRVADHLLWLGRYLERAEGGVRLLRSVFQRLSGEARPGDIPELPFLLALLHSENIIPEAFGDNGAIPPLHELLGRLNEALYRREHPQSIVTVLKQVREVAQDVRDRLSLDSWRVINRLEDFAPPPTGDPLELLDNTLFNLSAFSGLAMESMTRGLGWRFMDMGRRMERAMNLIGLIHIALSRLCIEGPNALEALLEVADSIMTYRGRYRTTFQLAPVLDLLLVDESNPKSLAFQLSRLGAHVDHLPRRSDRRFSSFEERLALEMLTAVRLLDLTDVYCSDEGKGSASLTAFLESVEARLQDFARQITAHYLTRVPTTPHFSAMMEDDRP